MKKLFLALLLATSLTAHGQRVIPLYASKAPGSESWTWQEAETTDNPDHLRLVYNVAAPTLTAYLPARGTGNGTAVIICPGGGFRTLFIDGEGTLVAQWLQARSVAAFVLKYRLVHSATTNPVQEVMQQIRNRPRFDSLNAPVVKLAIADGKKAIEYVRGHAAELGVQPTRIGLLGFSAGGTLTMGVGYTYSAANRPDFLAPIYFNYSTVPKAAVPADAPPLFVAAASDDQNKGFPLHSVHLYSDWLAAGKPAEVHVYAKGGHGFGLRQQHLPVDTWIDRFADWLQQQGFLPETTTHR